jgi:hypothetical protein
LVAIELARYMWILEVELKIDGWRNYVHVSKWKTVEKRTQDGAVVHLGCGKI